MKESDQSTSMLTKDEWYEAAQKFTNYWQEFHPKFYEYFNNTYLGNGCSARFPKELWSMVWIQPIDSISFERVNNRAELLNRMLKYDFFKCKRISLKGTIQRLQVVENYFKDLVLGKPTKVKN
jgi:hypothetical protein